MALSRQVGGTWPCCNAIIRSQKDSRNLVGQRTFLCHCWIDSENLPQGCTYLAQGDNANAQKAFEQARPAFEAAVKEAPDSAERHASLGWLYALMGRKNDAIAEGQRAVELKPESKDAVDGSLMNGYLALIYARVGESDLAIPLIERLLNTAGGS